MYWPKAWAIIGYMDLILCTPPCAYIPQKPKPFEGTQLLGHAPLGKANAKAAQALFEDDGLIIAAFLTSTWASEDSAFRILRVQGLGFRVGGFGGIRLRMQGLRALSGCRV